MTGAAVDSYLRRLVPLEVATRVVALLRVRDRRIWETAECLWEGAGSGSAAVRGGGGCGAHHVAPALTFDEEGAGHGVCGVVPEGGALASLRLPSAQN